MNLVTKEHETPVAILKEKYSDLLNLEGDELPPPDLIPTISKAILVDQQQMRADYKSALDAGVQSRNNVGLDEVRIRLEQNDFSGLDITGAVPKREDYTAGFWVSLIIGGAIGAVVVSVLGWAGFFVGIAALIGCWVGSMIGTNIDDGTHQDALGPVEIQDSHLL